MHLYNSLPSISSPHIEWAIFYATQNLKVIPVYEPLSQFHCSCQNNKCQSIGKHPRISGWQEKATTDINTIKKWWNDGPNSNVGIVTGKHSNIFVIDIDPKNGGSESLIKLELDHEKLTGGCVFTGGGGRHYYYIQDQTEEIRNKVNFYPGIDIRGNGGFIVAPPSLHVSGSKYIWSDERVEFPIPPKWIIEQLKVDKKLLSTNNYTPKDSSVISSGQRNNFLTSIGGHLRKFGFSQDVIQKNLEQINNATCVPPVEINEVAQISKSLAKYSPSVNNTPWEQPILLPQNKNEIPNMDSSFAPSGLDRWAKDITDRMQIPLEFILIPAIVGLSSLIGKKICIYPKQLDNWLVIPNLWGGIIAPPGLFKSPAIAEALKPLDELVEKENKIFEEKLSRWEIEKNINEATINAMKDQIVKALKKEHYSEVQLLKDKIEQLYKDNKKNCPVAKRFKTNDSTVEKICQLLLENPNGLLVLRDELSGWIAGLDRQGREGDREFYLEAWNGKSSYDVDRIGRGNLHIPNIRLSVFGGIQPMKLEKYLTSKNSLMDDGILQRFQLLVYPVINKEWKNIDRLPDSTALDNVNNIFNQIFRYSDEGIKLRFSTSAQVIFNVWREELEKEVRSNNNENHNYMAHIGKFRSLVPSLAIIFFTLKCLNDGTFMTNTTLVDSESLNLAIKWSELLKLHAKKIYKNNNDYLPLEVESMVEKIKTRKITDGMSLRSIYRNHWLHLGSNESVQSAIEYLTEYNWVRVEEGNEKFKKTSLLRLNPLLTNII